MRTETELMSGARLAIIAGGGDLPRRVAEQARRTGRNPLVVGLKGFVDASLLTEFGAHARVAQPAPVRARCASPR